MVDFIDYDDAAYLQGRLYGAMFNSIDLTSAGVLIIFFFEFFLNVVFQTIVCASQSLQRWRSIAALSLMYNMKN
jgi:hypothetical protein